MTNGSTVHVFLKVFTGFAKFWVDMGGLDPPIEGGKVSLKDKIKCSEMPTSVCLHLPAIKSFQPAGWTQIILLIRDPDPLGNEYFDIF